MPYTSNGSNIFLAIQALENDPKLSVRKAAALYNVSRTTLTCRRNGRCPRTDKSANSLKLTILEEEAIVKRALELDAQGFPVRISGVEDMANRLLRDRNASSVGTKWVQRFISRQPQLKTQMSRSYDNQRALCEDPEKIEKWFCLVRNTIAKYGVRDEDIYNFDETGFLMGIIGKTLVVTSSDRTANAKLIQPGNREWVTVIQGVNSQGWTIPPYVIFKGQWHLNSWYNEIEFPYGWRLSVSENGWTNNKRTYDWLVYFEEFTRLKTCGGYRLLILDGHKSHHSDNFEEYCRTNNILTLCLPPHSSHITQPLDVSCFGPLKKAYSRQIEGLVRNRVTHISKEAFLPAFKEAFSIALTKENIQAGFQGAGLIPYDPAIVISKLNIRLSTPLPENSRPTTSHSWIVRTPQTTTDAQKQTTHIKDKVVRHQDSSPTQILDAIDLFAKGTARVMHELTLLRSENHDLRRANEDLSRRRRTKRKRLQEGGSLSQEEARVLEGQDKGKGRIEGEEGQSLEKRSRVTSYDRHCRRCGEKGHNVRTCLLDSSNSSE